jgi:hypothetical protein
MVNLARHTILEISCRGKLEEGAPVPGCVCLRCAVLRIGGSEDDVRGAERLVGTLAKREADERIGLANAILERTAWTLPPARELVRYADAVRRQPVVGIELEPQLPPIRRRTGSQFDPLPVERAREESILEVARRLELGEPKRAGKEFIVRCPFHEDTKPSLRLNPRKNAWYCFPCNEGGDAIGLWERVRRVDFVTAVREIAA